MEIAFWVTVALVFWGYGGYALLLHPFLTNRQNQKVSGAVLPHITFVIPAYNEAKYLRAKLTNTLALDYPADRLTVLVAADGTTDDSAGVVSEFPAVQYVNDGVRAGKAYAMNRAAEMATGEFLVFSDANAMINPEALQYLVGAFRDPQVAMVSGEKKVIPADHTDVAGAGEGVYWRYESWLKKVDDRFCTLIGAPGELFAIRTSHYQPIPTEVLLDDFYLSMRMVERGYAVRYVPEAFAVEHGSANFKEEAKRKIRIAAGAWQAMGVFKSIWKFWQLPRPFLLYFSHRILRWAVIPWCFLLVPALLIALQRNEAGPDLYGILLASVLLFSMLALVGWRLHVRGGKIPAILNVPFYVLFMNVCALAGALRYFKGIKSGAWEKSQRA